MKITGDKREINLELVRQARCRTGIKGYVTGLDIPPQQVIDAYHQLFQVEKSFHMSKSDLKAKPVFHRKRDSIEAHLTIVFAALAIARLIESQTGGSIRKFIQILEPIRTGVVTVGDDSFLLKPLIPDDASVILDKLAASQCMH